MGPEDTERALWLSRNILPQEFSIRRIIGKWRIPQGLDVDDIVQEGYAKIAALPSVSHITSPKSYFLQIARSIILMHVRRAKLISIDVLADMEHLNVSEDEPSPETQASDREQLRLLAEAVAQLGEPHRSVFVMRMIHELSYMAIGQVLSLSDNAVQKIMTRNVRNLAEKIGRGGNAVDQASNSEKTNVISKADDNRHEK